MLLRVRWFGRTDEPTLTSNKQTDISQFYLLNDGAGALCGLNRRARAIGITKQRAFADKKRIRYNERFEMSCRMLCKEMRYARAGFCTTDHLQLSMEERNKIIKTSVDQFVHLLKKINRV